jgi:Tfp pilus assembly PilM family ATPase
VKFYPFSSPPLIGLDIQPGELRLIQMRKTRKTFVVEDASIIKLPETVFVDGKIKQWQELSLALRAGVEELACMNMAAAFSLPANLTRMQCLQVPVGISHAAIEEEIKVQVERDLPGLRDSLYIDFCISPSALAGYTNVFFVVTRQEYVSQYVDCLNATGLKVKIVDVDIFALKRILHFSSVKSLIMKSNKHLLINQAVNQEVNQIVNQAIKQEEITILICDINHILYLIVFTDYQIVFHQQWQAKKELELITKLKNQITTFLSESSSYKISKLRVYADDLLIAEIKNEANANWSCEVDSLNDFSFIAWSQAVKEKIALKHRPSFLLACGAAMREVPKW